MGSGGTGGWDLGVFFCFFALSEGIRKRSKTGVWGLEPGDIGTLDIGTLESWNAKFRLNV